MALYFLALIPPPGLEEQIRGFKLEMKQRYGVRDALRLPAHITLQYPFEMVEEQEPALEQAFISVANEETSFIVKLNGFDCFPPRVIFVKIEDHSAIASLHKRLFQAVRGTVSLPERKNAKSIHPHINIASRDLGVLDFKKGWEEFSDREFRAEFISDRFFLFRHDRQSWKIHRDFSLKG